VLKFYLIYFNFTTIRALNTSLDGKKCSDVLNACIHRQGIQFVPNIYRTECSAVSVFCSEHIKDKVLSTYLMHTSANECSVCSEDKCPKNDVLMSYEEESVNRSQMDMKPTTCDIRTWKKTFISRHILHQHLSHRFPVRRNPQHRSLLTVVSAISAPPTQRLRHQRTSATQL
jgi:hypothetical protein